jgi:uncharacterized protein with PIN domain
LRLLPFFLAFVFIGCQEGSKQAPDYLLSEDKMVDVMVDMHLVETAHNLKLMGTDSTYTEYIEKFNSIFSSHGVTKADYDSSLMYYTANTEHMPAIYDKILEELYEMESQVKADQ